MAVDFVVLIRRSTHRRIPTVGTSHEPPGTEYCLRICRWVYRICSIKIGMRSECIDTSHLLQSHRHGPRCRWLVQRWMLLYRWHPLDKRRQEYRTYYLKKERRLQKGNDQRGVEDVPQMIVASHGVFRLWWTWWKAAGNKLSKLIA